MGPKVAELLKELAPFPVFGGGGHEGVVSKTALIVTNYSVFLLLGLALCFVFFMVASRKVSLVPKGAANLAELGVEFVRDSIVVDVIGPEGLKYAPFVITVFFAVLFNNFLGLIPGFKPGTGTLGTTLTWGLMVFILYNAIGFSKNGVGAYIKSFIPSGTPWWLVWLIFPLEVISHFLRPFTLGVRLYANMYAGHIVLGVFAIFVDILLVHGMGPVSWGMGLLAQVMQIIMYAFEVFVAFIQAYVFAILTAVYISGAVHAKSH